MKHPRELTWGHISSCSIGLPGGRRVPQCEEGLPRKHLLEWDQNEVYVKAPV